MEWISVVGLVGFVGFALYRIIGRGKRLREAAEAREAAFVASLRGEFGAAGSGVPVVAEATPRDLPRPQPQPVVSTVTQPEASPGPAGPVAERTAPPYLSARQLQVYEFLRDTAPACAVFPRPYLHWLVGAAAGDKPQRLDFVCCDRTASPRLVVDVARADDERAVWEFKRERLAAVGIVYLRWDPADLPGREALAAQLAKVQLEPRA